MSIYRNNEVSIRKHKKNEYIIIIENIDDPQKQQFWNNFPFDKLDILSEKKEKGRKEYIVNSEYVKPLHVFLKEQKVINYNQALQFLKDSGDQIKTLEMLNLGFPFFDLKDFIVIDQHFFIMNTDRLLSIVNNQILINTVYKKTVYFSPEMENIIGIPSQINWKASFYSLAYVIVFSMVGVHHFKQNERKNVVENVVEDMLNKIYDTKLYWALKRCFEKDTKNRHCYII